MDMFMEEVVVCGSPELRLQVRELPMADGVHASTGNQVWTAGIVLAQELLRNPSLVRDKQVVEIGSGCGILGITAATLARLTIITDGDEEVVMNLDHNVNANRQCWQAKAGETPREIRTQRLDWKDDQISWPPEDKADVLLGSEIIYGHWGEIVARTMLNILAPDGMILMAASEDRRSCTRGFKEYCIDAGFRIIETKLTISLGKFRLYECRRRQATDSESYVFRERIEVENPKPEAVTALPAQSDEGRRAVPSALKASNTAGKVETATASPEPSPAVRRKEPLEQQIPAIQSAAHAGAGQRDVRKPSKEQSKTSVWEVVGGLQSGGILVRLGATGEFLKEKLAHGAVVEETGRTDLRLCYKKIRGEGPERGWVSFQAKGGGQMVKMIDVGEQ